MALETQKRGYRITEAATYLGASPWFVELRIREREIPVVKLGRRYIIVKEDLDAFLDRQRAKMSS